MSDEPRIIVISGLPGAGKSTAAALLAQQLPRAAHIEADRLQQFIVSGGEWPYGGRETSDEAERQLRLRLHNACLLARSFVEHGFSAIIDDIVIGTRLDELIEELSELPFSFVMLNPTYEHVRQRWLAMNSPFADSWAWIDEEIRLHTQHLGLWLDTTLLTPEQTVDQILADQDEAAFRR